MTNTSGLAADGQTEAVDRAIVYGSATTIRLGAGSTAGERIDEINRRARRVSERV